MLSDEEREAIDYLKARLYGNEGCKFIDVAQSDLRIFLNLVENLQKDIANWKKYCDEQEADITVKNNQICDLEFKIENQQKEIENWKFTVKYVEENYVSKEKIKAKIEELKQDEDFYREQDRMYEHEGKLNLIQSLLEEE